MRIICIVILACLLGSSSAYAQFATVDVAAAAATVGGFVEDVKAVYDSVEKLKEQIDQAKQQYEALSGTRNFGEIFYDQKFRDYLPSNWKQVYDQVRDGGYQGLSGSGRTLYEANKAFDSCSTITVEDKRRACEARAVKPAQDMALAIEAFNRAKQRIEQIESLMKKINETQDPKGIAEVQARISAEQAAIQNEQTKLQLFQMIASIQDRMQQQRSREIQAKTWASRGGIKAVPLTF